MPDATIIHPAGPAQARPPKLRTIELMRGLAALSVVLGHASTLVVQYTGLGFASFHHGVVLSGIPGVEFFFVLSGFVMAMMHNADRGHASRIPAFAWARLCRIVPLLWAVMAFRIWQLGDLPQVTPSQVLSWMLLNPLDDFDIIPVIWTLKLELLFYLLFALSLLPWVGRLVLLYWAAVTALFLLQRPLAGFVPEAALSVHTVALLLVFSPTFLCGVLAGTLFARLRVSRGGAAALAIAGATLAFGELWHDGWLAYGSGSAQLVYGLGVGALILGVAQLERRGSIRLRRWALACGALSYPLYVCHLPVIDAVATRLIRVGRPGWMGQDVVFVLLVASSLICCAALAYGLDRPVARALRRLGPAPLHRPAAPLTVR